MENGGQQFQRRGRLLVLVRVSLVVAALVFTLSEGALAKGKPGPTPAPGSASCSVSPNPAPLGGNYTISGSGYLSAEVLQVFVTDYASTTVLFTAADSKGNFATTWHTYRTGLDTVAIKDSSSGKILANCSFSVA